jgi:hypothetical protein
MQSKTAPPVKMNPAITTLTTLGHPDRHQSSKPKKSQSLSPQLLQLQLLLHHLLLNKPTAAFRCQPLTAKSLLK